MKYEFDSASASGTSWNKNSPKSILSYAIGALLYTPTLHHSIVSTIIDKKLPHLKSVALCLEDAISDSGVSRAEAALLASLKSVSSALNSGKLSIDDLPLIFVRFRSPFQMREMSKSLMAYSNVLTGVIVPKFDLALADDYIREFCCMHDQCSSPLYIMPIIESASVMDIRTRSDALCGIMDKLSGISDRVLCVRVGGNDFCGRYGFRRPVDRAIYEIGAVSSVLSDIINVFSGNYVVSAPVWEYFDGGDGSDAWRRGLEAELDLDRLNGFIGKTAVHPSQLLPIQLSHTVNSGDLEDARRILNWQNGALAVENSTRPGRMNEVRVHGKWAEKILALAEIYGVK